MKSKISSLTVADAGVYRESSNYASELCLDWKKKSAAKQLMLVADALFLFNKHFQAFLPKEQCRFSHVNGDASFKNTMLSSKE